MKRSEINAAFREASEVFAAGGWALPPEPRWDITDFGLGEFTKFGLILINLAEEPEYCEKLMYARPDQRTPLHTHKQKKEDIICRRGALSLLLYPRHPDESNDGAPFTASINGKEREVRAGEVFTLRPGERITLFPGVYHEFWASAEGTIIGEVSTANDDLHDNYFVRSDIGRFPGIDEDEPPEVRLISE